MSTAKKGKAARLYIGDEEEPLLETLAEATGLSQTMVMSLIVNAGLRSCRDAGNRLPLPLRFEIVEAAEPPTTKPRR